MVFVPSVLSGIIGVLLDWFSVQFHLNSTTGILISILGSIISFILSFASLDMMRDAYNNNQLNLTQSIGYVTGKFFSFLIAAVIGGLMSITIILIPIVIMMFVILVIDETTLGDSISKAFNVLRAEFGDIILIIIISIIGSFIISYIPYISSLLKSVLNVIISLSFIDLYINFKFER